jgi:3-oxoacyl-[acyl-carrier protein] reductase
LYWLREMRRRWRRSPLRSNKPGPKRFLFAIDLSQAEESKIIVDTTLERFGRIDALLNIAGAVPQIDLFEITDEA